jgi:hypothetical protein
MSLINPRCRHDLATWQELNVVAYLSGGITSTDKITQRRQTEQLPSPRLLYVRF